MRRVSVGALMFALVVAHAACRGPAASAERLDVVVDVRPDGSVEVREALVVRLAESVTTFARRVDLERADGVDWLRAALDGHSLQPGTPGEARVAVDDGEPLTVTWTFPPDANVSRTFELAYRVRGAMAVRGQRGTLQQVVVARGRGYRIGTSRISLVVPAGVHVFEGTIGMAERGWTVTRTPAGIDAERTGVGPDERATVMVEIAVDPAVIGEPSWQRYEEWTGQIIPAFVSAGLFILVIGAGVLWIIRFQYPRRPAGYADERAVAEERERQTVRDGLRTAGLIGGGLAVVLAGVTWVTLGHFGVWPLALPLGIFVVGLVFVVVGPRYV